MSIEKPTHISKHLEDLIEAANKTIRTIKDQILEIYHTAVMEGFAPIEARILVEERVIKASKRYIRLIVPDEAKETKFIPHKRNSDVELFPPTIPTAYDIKEAETVKEWDLPEPEGEREEPEIIIDSKLLDEKIKEIARLEEENARLRIAKVPTFGNKFDFDYDLEVKDQILPLIVTCFPDKKTGYVRLDKAKLGGKK